MRFYCFSRIPFISHKDSSSSPSSLVPHRPRSAFMLPSVLVVTLLSPAVALLRPTTNPRAPMAALQVFPTPPPADSPERENRNARMATLLSRLIEAPDSAPEILRASNAMLLAPFRGSAEPDSVYGEGSVAEKLRKYTAAMDERITRATDGQAHALRLMRDHVVAELLGDGDDDLDTILRLRGGSAVRSRLHQGLDAVCDTADVVLHEARRLAPRSRLRPLPTTTDAVLAGGCAGFMCGKVFIGDPKLMALVGASAFAYTRHNPDQVPPRACAIVGRACDWASRLRRAVVEALQG